MSADIIQGQVFDFDGFENLHIKNAASYQMLNAALAVTAVNLLGDQKPCKAYRLFPKLQDTGSDLF